MWQFEYHDLLNSAYHTAIRTGAEFSYLEMIYVRLGSYKENKDDYGFSESNKNTLSDFTYGLGIELPIEGLTDAETSLVVKLDFAKMKQPGSSKLFDNWENFSVYNLSANWRLKK